MDHGYRLACTSAALAIMAVTASVAIVAGASPAASDIGAAPYGPTTNGTIVYSKDGDIWTVDARGQAPAALISGPDTDIWPIYSRDGAQLMFERDAAGGPRRLMVASADGRDPVPFMDVPAEFPWSDWSPDGVHFAAESKADGQYILQILTTDRSAPARTLDLGDVDLIDLAGFRPPDGNEIVFSGHPKAGSADFGLYAIGVDGSGLRTIGDIAPGGAFGDMAFSPDGTSIAYWNFEPGIRSGFNLYQRDLATGATTPLSLDPAYPWLGFAPHYTPDGASLVFESGPHPASAGLDGQLIVAPLDGGGPSRTLGPAYPGDDRESFDISPDGTTLLFDLNGATWFIDLATGEATQSTEYLPDQPSWQRR